MNTLWSFGDSYAECYPHGNNQYLNQIAHKLNLVHNPYGLSGTSISHTAYMLNKCRNYINDNDIVIIALTNVFRRWFFEDKPRESALAVNTSKKEQDAILKYRKYLDNHLENETILVNFLYNLYYLTEKKNLHTVILLGFKDSEQSILKYKNEFPRFHISIGTLDTICFGELENNFLKSWINTPLERIGDSRLNHMIYSNHCILTDKIIDNIHDNTQIDLNTGFIKNIIDFDTKNNIEFHNKEFFGNKWMFGL